MDAECDIAVDAVAKVLVGVLMPVPDGLDDVPLDILAAVHFCNKEPLLSL